MKDERFPSWYVPLARLWTVLGLLLGAVGMWAAWGENSNEEIYSYTTGAINWAEWLPVGVGGFVILGLAPLAVTTLVAWLAGLWFRSRR